MCLKHESIGIRRYNKFLWIFLMIINRAYKIRLYPTKGQRTFFNKTFGCCRSVYNTLLYDRNQFIKEKDNKLAVEVYRYSTASWLEDQDFWRMFGIFRPVTLVAHEKDYIKDLEVIGATRVESTKKRTRYTYNIEKLVDELHL